MGVPPHRHVPPDRERSPMALDIKVQLSALSIDELKELAGTSAVDTAACTSKEDFVEVLARNGVVPRPPSLERAAWAYAILSCQRLIEDCGKAGREVDDAAALLLEAKQAFRSNTLGSRLDLLARLQEVSRNLYSQEMQRSRAEIYRVQEMIGNATNMGANVVLPDELLNRARDALRRNDPLLALQMSAEAERLSVDTLRARVKEIED